MIELLGLVLISFFITSFLLVPYIDLLFHLKKKAQQKFMSDAGVEAPPENKVTPIHNKILGKKDFDTPIGGGILLIIVVVLLSMAYFYVSHQRHIEEFYILALTILSFGFIGFLDDYKKIFAVFVGKYIGIKARYLLLIQIIFALMISLLLYYVVGLNNVYIPILGNIILGWWYVPLAVFAIVSFANAYNISDGLDGLSTGLLVICLFAFLVVAHTVFDMTLSIFVGIWIGSLIAYLYFNVFPARVILGDAGAFGFGATLAVVGLLTGKIVAVGIIGGVYIIIVLSSLLQILFKRILHRKLFPVAPIHMYFKYIGWEEPKIVMRFWLAGSMFAILGLWLALLSK